MIETMFIAQAQGSNGLILSEWPSVFELQSEDLPFSLHNTRELEMLCRPGNVHINMVKLMILMR
jgi:hypothetical protein